MAPRPKPPAPPEAYSEIPPPEPSAKPQTDIATDIQQEAKKARPGRKPPAEPATQFDGSPQPRTERETGWFKPRTIRQPSCPRRKAIEGGPPAGAGGKNYRPPLPLRGPR